MRTSDYLVLTFIAVGLTYLMVVPVARFINQSFTEAALRIEEMNGG